MALQLAGAGVMWQQIDLMLHKIACNILIQIYYAKFITWDYIR